ncbi:MAG: ribosomal L7Ae/L30e/S12e/Gadd45 family protein [Lachnospiraceae bacterium]|nr:ribosomal L7Ae/L30e/S12e/Gadd45 family protein [Lachnospiraceae bacterium]
MAEKKLYSLLGLSQRGGHMASGEFMTEKAVKEGRAFLCIVAEDSSDNTKKMFRNMCEFYHVPFCCFSDKNTLGHRIGKEFRASLAVLDAGLAKAAIGYLGALGVTVGN